MPRINLNEIQLKGHVASCRGLILAFVIGPPKHTPTPSAKHTTEGNSFSCAGRLCCEAWELDASLCVFIRVWEMPLGWVHSLFVYVLQSFSLGRSRLLLLLDGPNAIMAAAAARVSHSGTFSAAHAAVLGLRRNPVDNNVSRLAAETFACRCV